VGVRDEIFALTEPVVEQLGYQLIDVEYVKEGPRWFVRVFIDKPEGIGLEDCKVVNDAVDAVLEENDPVKNPYFLEISSPGLERVLKTEREFKIFQGRYVLVSLKEPHNKEYKLYGHLGPLTDTTVQITDAEGHHTSLSRENVKQIRLALQPSAPAGK
jgi:ribosome maturation factor RimP